MCRDGVERDARLFLSFSHPPSPSLPSSLYLRWIKKEEETWTTRGRRKVTLDRLMVGSGCHGGSEGRVRPPEIGLSLFERPREPHGGLGFRACFHSFRWLLSSMRLHAVETSEQAPTTHPGKNFSRERDLLFEDVARWKSLKRSAIRTDCCMDVFPRMPVFRENR